MIKLNWKVVRDWIFVLSVFGIAVYLFFFLSTASSQCLKDPLTYGAKTLSIANQGELTCNYIGSHGGTSFKVNSSGWTITQPKIDDNSQNQEYSIDQPNYTQIAQELGGNK